MIGQPTAATVRKREIEREREREGGREGGGQRAWVRGREGGQERSRNKNSGSGAAPESDKKASINFNRESISKVSLVTDASRPKTLRVWVPAGVAIKCTWWTR